MTVVLIFSLALFAFAARASVLVPEHELGVLYTGYNGEYAGQYKNYEKSYAYEYGVSDPHTGDHKTQWETKDKDGTVRGSYSLLEPDGTTRIVDYLADEHGFRAVVKKVGLHGTTLEAHGGAEEHNDVTPPIAAPIEVIVEDPVVYKSYDGGYKRYVGDDIYVKPNAIEFVNVPPQHHEEHSYVHPHNAPLYPRAEGLIEALPQEYWPAAGEGHVHPQAAPKLIQEYVAPQYTAVPATYPHVPSEKMVSYSYVQPKAEGIFVEPPKVVPEPVYYPASSLEGQYELNLDYHY